MELGKGPFWFYKVEEKKKVNKEVQG